VNGYALLVTVHVLLLVLWLGTDIGVFIGSFRLKDPRLSTEARLEIGRLTALLDMGPRTGVILSIPTGLSLAYAGGWGRREPELLGPTAIAVAAVASLGWLAMVWRYFALQQRAARGAPLAPGEARFMRVWRRADLWWRIVLALGIAVATGVAIVGRGLFGVLWLDWKVALFGFIVACGVAIRIAADDLPIALGEIGRKGSTAEREGRVSRSLGAAYPWVIAIYVSLVVMAYLSFAKPS